MNTAPSSFEPIPTNFNLFEITSAPKVVPLYYSSPLQKRFTKKKVELEQASKEILTNSLDSLKMAQEILKKWDVATKKIETLIELKNRKTPVTSDEDLDKKIKNLAKEILRDIKAAL